MMEVSTTAEHEWLQQIVGEWNAEGEANIEIVTPAERTLTSKMQMPDGSWNRIMFARYKRVK